jgi:hypothetical protein
MLEVIIHGDSEFELYNVNWSPEDRRNALAYLKAVELFEFIYALNTLQRSLYLKEAVVKLQGKKEDIASGVGMVQQCIKQLESLRTGVDEYAGRIYQHSCAIVERSGIEPSMP